MLFSRLDSSASPQALTRLLSADRRCLVSGAELALVSLLESALPKCIPIKSFRIRTYEKRGGGGASNSISASETASEIRVGCWQYSPVLGTEAAAGQALAPCWI